MRNLLKRFSRPRRLNSAGDTIVEVLIVLAVLGLAMSVSYATANRGLQKSRTAQEHSQALGIINSQIELLRSAFALQNGGAIETQAASGPFCLSVSGGNVAATAITNSGPNAFNENIANDHLTSAEYPGACQQEGLYHVSIVGRGGGVYDVRVRWEGLGKQGRQQEELTYKIGNVLITPTNGYTDAQVPPAPVVVVPLTLTFTASPTTVLRDGTTTLSWSTSPAGASCTASDGWSGAKPENGSEVVTVSTKNASASYSLTCTSATSTVSKTVTVSVTEPQLAPFYRMFAWANFDHFYTTSLNEVQSAGSIGYFVEGTAGSLNLVQGPGDVPLYRLNHSGIGDHFYTVSAPERDQAVGYGYVYEGIAGYLKLPVNGTCPDSTIPLYRMYSSILGDHFYTVDWEEYAGGYDKRMYGGIGIIFRYYNAPEGIAGCVYKE